jgi:RNA polymerase sigma-70 factor, ECF subfamily
VRVADRERTLTLVHVVARRGRPLASLSCRSDETLVIGDDATSAAFATKLRLTGDERHRVGFSLTGAGVVQAELDGGRVTVRLPSRPNRMVAAQPRRGRRDRRPAAAVRRRRRTARRMIFRNIQPGPAAATIGARRGSVGRRSERAPRVTTPTPGSIDCPEQPLGLAAGSRVRSSRSGQRGDELGRRAPSRSPPALLAPSRARMRSGVLRLAPTDGMTRLETAPSSRKRLAARRIATWGEKLQIQVRPLPEAAVDQRLSSFWADPGPPRLRNVSRRSFVCTGVDSTRVPTGERLSELGDAELLRESTRSDEAFRALYDRYAERVFTYLLRACRDREAARDLVAETFARVWLAAPSYRPSRGGESAVGWVYAIARHALIDSVRRATLERAALERIGAFEVVEPEEPPANPDASWLTGLDDALATLSASEREAVLARYADDLSYAQIARRLDTTPRAARARVSRALHKLRRALVRLTAVEAP